MLADGRLGVVDFGLVARLPDGLPAGDGPDPARSPNAATPSRSPRSCAAEGFVGDDVDAQDLLDYLAPFVEPAAVEEFQFNRDWMREQFIRVTRLRRPPAGSG